MNYITAAKNTKKLSETELKHNISGKASWHYQYKDSAWIYIGGLPYDLTEGDIICVFSQYGEVVNLNLPRDKKTGKSKGFCFLCYEDQRSTILAVDNLNTIKLCGRIVRVDHVEEYKVPKNIDKLDDDAMRLLEEGCGPESAIAKTLQEKPSESDERSKRVLEAVKSEPHPPLRSRSPPRFEDARQRNREDRSRAEDAGSKSDRSKRREDSKSSTIERKENENADRKREEKSTRNDEESHSSYDSRRREERSDDYERDRSKKYDDSRRGEKSRHRDRSRSKSRDRERRRRSRSRSRDKNRKHRSRSRETDRKYRR